MVVVAGLTAAVGAPAVIAADDPLEVAPPVLDGSGVVVSPPEWFPLRGSWYLGCAWDNGCAPGSDPRPGLDLATDDFGSRSGDVVAAGAGTVVEKVRVSQCWSTPSGNPQRDLGNTVVIDHGEFGRSVYAHLGSIWVGVGDHVEAGHKVGTVGSTGHVSPCWYQHLYFAVQDVDGDEIDPGSLRTCQDHVEVTYPDHFGLGSWSELPWFDFSRPPMRHDGIGEQGCLDRPGPPTSVAAAQVEGRLEVGWDVPGDDGGVAVQSYVVVATDGSRRHEVATTATVVPLDVGDGDWRVEVRAVNAVGEGEAATAGPVTVDARGSGYWVVDASGVGYGFGDAPSFVTGSGVVAAATVPDGRGVWVLGSDGVVDALAGGVHHGDVDQEVLEAGEEARAIAVLPDGSGYWVVTDRGRVLAFGAASDLGDLLDVRLSAPVVAAAATPSGQGLFLVGSDGGVFSFGDAWFRGSMGGRHLNAPIVGIAPDPDGLGYRLVAADGGVFSFDAEFRGSMGGRHLNAPVVGGVPDGGGYLLVAADGGVFDFGAEAFRGSLGADPPARPVVAIAAFS